MTARDPQPGRLPPLDEYIDGLVTGSDRARIESDPAAAAELKLQQAIDASLRREFVPIEIAAPIARRRMWPWLAAAAAVLLSIAGVYFAMVLTQPRPDLGAIYAREVAMGFTPAEVCTTPSEFAGWVTRKFGEPLYPATGADTQLLGWSYAVAMSNYSGVLLADVDGRHVIVVLDKSKNETRKPARLEDPSLHLYRASIGGLILYEVSPLPSARILPALTTRPPSARTGVKSRSKRTVSIN